MAKAMPVLYELVAEAVRRQGGVRPVEQGEGRQCGGGVLARIRRDCGGRRGRSGRCSRDRGRQGSSYASASRFTLPRPSSAVVERAIAAGARLAMPALLAGTFYAQASIGQLNGRATRWPGTRSDIGRGPYGNTSALTGIARIELLLDQPDKAAEHARLTADINDRQLRNPLM